MSKIIKENHYGINVCVSDDGLFEFYLYIGQLECLLRDWTTLSSMLHLRPLLRGIGISRRGKEIFAEHNG